MTHSPARPLALVPLALAVLGVVIPLVGSDFTVWGMALIWLAAVLAVTVGRAVFRPQPSMRVFVDLVLLVMTAIPFAAEGGLWFVPAIVAQGVLDWRAASIVGSSGPSDTW